MGVKPKRHNETFLDQVYDLLDYKSGDLIDIGTSRNNLSPEGYMEKGQWVETCASINKKTKEFKIDTVFFVQENPVVVFVDATNKQKGEIFKVFNSIWSLARPRLVFIENKSSVSVYDLASIPAKSDKELDPLVDIIKESKQILSELRRFDRESIESGLTFDNKRFDAVNNRADQTLISDLKQARKKLFEQRLDGVKLKYAHALIGRSIFIRYLEDRGVLTKDYFYELAKDNPEEIDIVETPLQVNFYREEMQELIYPRILSNKSLTFKLFRKVANDFNGDTFATDSQEESIIEQSHLDLLQNFLLGAGNTEQLSLYLWAYRFDIIPIDLISSIYEEFYHSENLIDEETQKLKDSKGTHYTPSSLVEFVLARTLTIDVLKDKPRVLDPACGSGIFLVESFRRMVRYELYRKNEPSLDLEELLQILKEQIAGIEINPEAIKIAAFSLYLSLLNYLNPPNILNYIKKGGKLPYLINHSKSGKNHFNILLESNTFDTQRVNLIFPSSSFDLIVGNPPWGTPGTKDVEARRELKAIIDWCDKANVELPDKEPSHAFLWRALDFLKPKGISALLVSSGVLLKFSDRSNTFKQQLLNCSTFKEVINFSHVRRVFFSSAISPFILVKLQKASPSPNSIITYLSLRRSKSIEKNKVVLIDRTDFKRIKQSNTYVNDIWKIYYWGSDYDFQLINAIRRFSSLKDYADIQKSGQGFQIANKANEAEWLLNYKAIPVKYFDNPFNTIDLTKRNDQLKLESIPAKVKLRGKEDFYSGKRILIRRGVIQSKEPKGQIIARLETDEFAFNHSLICIKLEGEHNDLYKAVAGIMWSSLFRYYMFMTASTWGTWRQEIHLNEVLEFPIAIPSSELKNKISKLVDDIQAKNKSNTILLEDTQAIIQPLLTELDILVFDLYELTGFERSLIMDRCNLTIDYYYKGERGLGSQSIKNLNYLSDYIQIFKNYWKRKLGEGETFSHTYITSRDKTMIGIVFKLGNVNDINNNEVSEIDISEFKELLESETSRNVFIEGLFRRVTENDQIIIIKRNRKSNWTKTEAKFDAEATFLEILKTPTDNALR